MKNIFKNSIFMFILGAIVFSFISVVAVTQINASQISYTDFNNNATTVDLVLNDLYTKVNKTITTADITSSTAQGNGEATKSTTITLNKGKYLITSAGSTGWPSPSSTSSSQESTSVNISCTNNCTINKLYGHTNEPHSTNQSNNAYNSLGLSTFVYYVEVSTDNTVITAKTGTGYSNPSILAQAVQVSAIKIN